MLLYGEYLWVEISENGMMGEVSENPDAALALPTDVILRAGTRGIADGAFTDLEKQGIFAEFCDGDYIVFYLSPATKLAHFKRLCKALKILLEKYPYIENERIPAPLVLQKTGEEEWVDLSLSIGKICAEDCGLFPPCTPLLVRGEVITEEKLSLLQSAKNRFGLWQGKIAVFKTQNDA